MSIRLEEKVASFISPLLKLSVSDAREVLKEFLLGTNRLTIEGQKILFSPTALVGGLLSGGLVYALMAKKMVERYGDETACRMNVIAVAVDAAGKCAHFSRRPGDERVEQLVLVDDMIDRGGSMHRAVTAAEDVFTAATIHSGVRTSFSRGRVPPSQVPHLEHLDFLFQDFAHLTDSNQLDEARAVLITALNYSRENGVLLQPGWYIVAGRYFKDASELIGQNPHSP